MPNTGRSLPAYYCAGLYVANGRGDRQFSLVAHVGSILPAEYVAFTRTVQERLRRSEQLLQ